MVGNGSRDAYSIDWTKPSGTAEKIQSVVDSLLAPWVDMKDRGDFAALTDVKLGGLGATVNVIKFLVGGAVRADQLARLMELSTAAEEELGRRYPDEVSGGAQ